MDESPFGVPPEETEVVIQALEQERSEHLPQVIRALRNRNFRLFWSGNFLSNIGTWMQNVAQGWLVLTLTNSAFWLGVVGFAGSIPFLDLHAVWRRDRRSREQAPPAPGHADGDDAAGLPAGGTGVLQGHHSLGRGRHCLLATAWPWP